MLVISNLSIDEIEVRLLYKGDVIAWAATINNNEIGEVITNSFTDGELVQRIAEAIFAERQKSDDIEPVTS